MEFDITGRAMEYGLRAGLTTGIALPMAIEILEEDEGVTVPVEYYERLLEICTSHIELEVGPRIRALIAQTRAVLLTSNAREAGDI